ncbi:MAG: hypothetical protein GY696_23425 [Gammaproteobacteria bacterium]|nr:hypothetical protein [Gammaproteobacteria bacterium]
MMETANICRDEDTARNFARQKGLLPNQNFIPCTFTGGCNGTLKQTTVRDKGKDRAIWRCGKCKKKRAVTGGSSAVGGQGAGTFFARKDSLNKANVKIGVPAVLLLLLPFLDIIDEISRQMPQ